MSTSVAESRSASLLLASPVGNKDHRRGHESSALQLVVYGNYECEQCRQAWPVWETVLAQHGDGLLFVFRHFSSLGRHPRSWRAAEAAEAANAQGRFWEMHRLLFTQAGTLERTELLACAAAAGLDLDRFDQELTEGTHFYRVQDDLISGVKSGVSATPGVFLNGRAYEGACLVEPLSHAVRQALDGAYGAGRAHHHGGFNDE